MTASQLNRLFRMQVKHLALKRVGVKSEKVTPLKLSAFQEAITTEKRVS